MPTSVAPNDFLRRYVLRRGALRKVRGRLQTLVREGTRDVTADAAMLRPDARVVFDVGANIGYVAHDFSNRWPRATIHCFEPTPDTFAQLAENVGTNPKVHCVQAAVSNLDGHATFNVDNRTFGGGANSLLDHSEQFDLTAGNHDYRPIDVSTLRLDTYCDGLGIDHIDVLKLDIEGAEPLALEGATGLLTGSAIDIIVSETRLVPGYEGSVLTHDLIAQLQPFGYRPFGFYRFAKSAIGQSLWGDVMFLGPAFRADLLAQHGARACGFLD